MPLRAIISPILNVHKYLLKGWLDSVLFWTMSPVWAPPLLCLILLPPSLLWQQSPDLVCTLSCFSPVQFFPTQWTPHVLLSMGFSGQEYWSGLPYPPPGGLSDSGIKLTPPAAPDLQVDSLRLSHWGGPKVQRHTLHFVQWITHSSVGPGLCRAALCCPQMFWISSLCSQLRQPLVPCSMVSTLQGHLCSWTVYASLGRKGDLVGWKRGWDPSVSVFKP